MAEAGRVKRSDAHLKGRLITAIQTYLPGAWIQPSKKELVALYRLRYRMALDERKFDTAMVFLNKILEVDPANLEAKLNQAELYHFHIKDYALAVRQYSKVVRLTAGLQNDVIHVKARDSLSELLELLS